MLILEFYGTVSVTFSIISISGADYLAVLQTFADGDRSLVFAEVIFLVRSVTFPRQQLQVFKKICTTNRITWSYFLIRTQFPHIWSCRSGSPLSLGDIPELTNHNVHNLIASNQFDLVFSFTTLSAVHSTTQMVRRKIAHNHKKTKIEVV
jgi:hypothetical protein